MVNRRTFRIGRRDVRAERKKRSHGIVAYDLDVPSPAQRAAAIRSGEKFIGTKWIPKAVQRLSYPTHDRVSGRKRIPLRVWSLRRGDVAWADYNQEIIKKKEPYLISQSPWVLVMSAIRLCLIPLSFLLFGLWLKTLHVGIVHYGPSLITLRLPLAPLARIIIDGFFVLAALSVPYIPLRMLNRRITWWTVYYVPIEAGILFYSGWWLPQPFLAQESNVEYARVHYGIWPLKYFWGFLNVGDIIFYGQDSQEIARMRKIRDPEGCFSVLIEPLLLGTEQAERRAADYAQVSAAHDEFRSRLSVLLTQQNRTISDEEMAELARQSGLDPADVGLNVAPLPEVSTDTNPLDLDFPDNI